jgi:hypothetical protein
MEEDKGFITARVFGERDRLLVLLKALKTAFPNLNYSPIIPNSRDPGYRMYFNVSICPFLDFDDQGGRICLRSDGSVGLCQLPCPYGRKEGGDRDGDPGF